VDDGRLFSSEHLRGGGSRPLFSEKGEGKKRKTGGGKREETENSWAPLKGGRKIPCLGGNNGEKGHSE